METNTANTKKPHIPSRTTANIASITAVAEPIFRIFNNRFFAILLLVMPAAQLVGLCANGIPNKCNNSNASSFVLADVTKVISIPAFYPFCHSQLCK